MKFDQEAVLSLIEHIYATTSDPAEFHTFLAKVSGLLSAPTSSLIVRNQAESLVQVASAIGLDPEYKRLYEEYYANCNVWFPNGKPPELNVASVGSEMVPEAQLLRSEYYNDYLRPQGLCFMTGVSVQPSSSVTLSFSALRGRARGEFSRSELALLQALVPHLQRALSIRQRIEEAELLSSLSSEALDDSGVALALLDGRRRVRFMNRTMETIVTSNHGIEIRDNRLRILDHLSSQKFNELIDSCFRKVSPTDGPGGVVRVGFSPEKRPYLLNVDPYSIGTHLGRPTFAAVFVRDPNRGSWPSKERMMLAFGLTAAEARLAALLTQGFSLKEIGAEVQVTQNTLRSQLKSIFLKTETSRQGELIGLLLKSFAK